MNLELTLFYTEWTKARSKIEATDNVVHPDYGTYRLPGIQFSLRESLDFQIDSSGKFSSIYCVKITFVDEYSETLFRLKYL